MGSRAIRQSLVLDRAPIGGPRSVFLAAPMSGFSSDDAYQFHRQVSLGICFELEARGVGSVYFAGRDIPSQSNFNSADDAFMKDYEALSSCDLFVLYYPEPVRSSVLVEAGIAIGLRKPSILMSKTSNDLVYLLRNATGASGKAGVPRMDIYEWGDGGAQAIQIAGRVLDFYRGIKGARKVAF